MTTGQQASRVPGSRPSQRVLVIIPTFNELENLPLIHQRLKAACPEVHLLIVDDSSPDGTGGARQTSWRRPMRAARTSCTAPPRMASALLTWRVSPGV